MRTAIYPGTFDPITYGHLDVLKRAARLFDEVVIAVAKNERKKPIFTQTERIELVEANIKDITNVRAICFDGLTVELARTLKAQAIIRGLRAISDFEFEFQMAQMNRHLDDSIETLFLMPNQEYFYTSSNLIKQVSRYTTDRLAKLVPPNVLERLKQVHQGK